MTPFCVLIDHSVYANLGIAKTLQRQAYFSSPKKGQMKFPFFITKGSPDDKRYNIYDIQ